MTIFGVGRTVGALVALGLLGAGCGADAAPATAAQGEAIFGFGEAAAPLFVAPERGERPRFPILLAHGFDGSRTNRWSFNGVEAALNDAGYVAVAAEVSPYQPVEVRSAQLARAVDDLLARTGAAKVHIIAHSMGGLDARDLIARPGYAAKVQSLTTIATPHHGSAVADVGAGLVPGGPAGRAIDALAAAWAGTFTDPELTAARVGDALASITTAALDGDGGFNATHPNADGVYYRTWAGVSSTPVLGVAVFGPHDARDCTVDGGTFYRAPSPFRAHATDVTLVPGQAILADLAALAPNDGMVTVASAKLDGAEFMGCIPADHLAEVGQPGRGFDPWTGFDHVAFYLDVAYGLRDLER